MNVLDLLKEDHRAVAKLLDEAQQCEPGDAKLDKLGAQITQMLTVHATVEEELFYPELRRRAESGEDVVDVYEAYTEHDVVKHLIALLARRRKDESRFKAELQVLGENVKHHVREEESTIFKLAREVLEEKELEQIGLMAQAEKQRLMRSGGGRKKKAAPARKGARKSSNGSRKTGKSAAGRKTAGARKGGARKKRSTR